MDRCWPVAPCKGHYRAVGRNLPKQVACTIGHIESAIQTKCNPTRVVKRGGNQSAICRACDTRFSSQCRCHPGGGDLADQVIASISHIDRAGSIRCYILWTGEPG